MVSYKLPIASVELAMVYCGLKIAFVEFAKIIVGISIN